MAKYGSYTEAVGRKTTQGRFILLSHTDEVQQDAERKAAEELDLTIEEKFLCLGHHEPSAARKYLVIAMANEKVGKMFADKITRAGQLIRSGNPNQKNVFSKEE